MNVVWGMKEINRKVLIVDSDRKGLLIRPIRIARALNTSNYKVEFLLWDRTSSKPCIEYFESFRIHNFKFKPPIAKTWALIPAYFVWWIYVVYFLCQSNAAIYHTENLYNLIPTIPIKIIKGKKIVYDLVDYVADSFAWPEPIRILFTWLENSCLKYTDAVIVVDARKQKLKSGNIKRFAVVTNCPSDLKNKFLEHNEGNDFIVYYGGWLSETRGLSQVCKAVEGIVGVKLVIAGTGPYEKNLRTTFAAQPNIKFLGLLSDLESLEWTSKSSVVFACYDPKIRINKLASPAKLYDAMMCGKPVIVNDEAFLVAATVNSENCGLIVPYGAVAEIKTAILELQRDINLRTQLGRNGRKAFENKYNWDAMQTELINIYDEVVQE